VNSAPTSESSLLEVPLQFLGLHFACSQLLEFEEADLPVVVRVDRLDDSIHVAFRQLAGHQQLAVCQVALGLELPVAQPLEPSAQLIVRDVAAAIFVPLVE
jgi:hypothetical protein